MTDEIFLFRPSAYPDHRPEKCRLHLFSYDRLSKGLPDPCLPSSKHISSAPLLRAVPLGEPTGDLESKFTVYECLAQLLGEASIALPAARSALEKI